ncbi:MAG: hypothetical protein IPP19_08750 [Verrucomicrobia bacterium]|nr:hypothetical protein [Verrucomicrobiota bacterium]
MTTSTDRLTAYGGAAAWSHYLEKLGLVTDLARRFLNHARALMPRRWRIFCRPSVQRSDGRPPLPAHTRRIQDDQAIAVILGMKKAASAAKTFTRLFAKVPRPKARTGSRGVNAICTPRAAPRPSSPTGTRR